MSAPYAAQQPIVQQPIASQGMTVNPRNSLNKPDVEGKGREWSYDLCSCNDCGTFCLAWCLPCIVYGSNKERLNYLERNGSPDPNRGGVCNSNCLMFALLAYCGVSGILACSTRESVRHRYNIAGGSCTDCLTSCYCLPCALSQEEAEIDLEEKALAQQAGYPKA